MWLRTGWRLKKALRRYRNDRDLESVLQMDWAETPLLNDFFSDLEERLYGEEITKLRQKQAEYLALQNQINPHFLYNALEAIRTDALLADCEDIAETTEALATFFRYTISNVKEYVTFSDELDNTENYFTIQRCRFGDKISMELELENEQLLEARMPKLILQPLVENAIKYNHSGGKVTVNIHLSEEITDTSTSVNYVFLEVSDTGIGIPPEYQEKIFTPFFRVDKSRSRAMGGAGLGLALVSEIVRQHNGQVKVLESSKKGSMIAIMLPV